MLRFIKKLLGNKAVKFNDKLNRLMYNIQELNLLNGDYQNISIDKNLIYTGINASRRGRLTKQESSKKDIVFYQIHTKDSTHTNEEWYSYVSKEVLGNKIIIQLDEKNEMTLFNKKFFLKKYFSLTNSYDYHYYHYETSFNLNGHNIELEDIMKLMPKFYAKLIQAIDFLNDEALKEIIAEDNLTKEKERFEEENRINTILNFQV